ncbi:hypothetical protein QBC38DRAFT_376328 [Podospora fimiseda]|uniref:Rhodopsin domain-containing protein n=1 Tax=Podospora fimiseda TaxID=252190 RepID=A0AAN6YS75_9PEZI|nr:hypothetical protein QBC38DRAFT_376328 [Podospora fimiseda]
MTLNDNGTRRLVVNVTVNGVAVLATILRFWCKLTTRNGVHADDWWLLATVISFLGAESAILWGLFDGSEGKEMAEIINELMTGFTPEKLQRMENFLMSLFIGNTILYLSFFLARMSILSLYRRVFATPKFKRACLILMGVNLAFFIGAEVGNFCICIPIDIFWHRLKTGGRCLNFNLFSFIIGLVELVLDTAILVLPIRAIVALQMPTKTKALISGIFLVGGFAIITGILKVYYQYRPNGFYVNFNKSELWYHIHGLTVILCACLPVYGPLRRIASGVVGKMREGYNSSLRRMHGSSGSRSKLREQTDGPNLSHPSGMEMEGFYSHAVNTHKDSTRQLVVVNAV